MQDVSPPDPLTERSPGLPSLTERMHERHALNAAAEATKTPRQRRREKEAFRRGIFEVSAEANEFSAKRAERAGDHDAAAYFRREARRDRNALRALSLSPMMGSTH